MARVERLNIAGKDIEAKVRELIHQGNIRRVRLIRDGKTMIEIPLTVGIPSAAVLVMAAPVLAAVAAFAALVSECTLEIEKVEDPADES